MKLPDYAKHLGISYQTAWRWWKAGKLPHSAKQAESGTVIVDFRPKEEEPPKNNLKVAIYARVSSAENKSNLDCQAERLTEYAMTRGYQIVKVVKEIGSGLNDNRKKLDALLRQDDYDILLVEHRDILARFGTNYLDLLLSRLGVRLEIVNLADNGRDELGEDLVTILPAFATGLYGQRKARQKAEKIIKELSQSEGEGN